MVAGGASRCLALALLLLCLLWVLLKPSSPPQCMDESGRPVAWWVILKYPGRSSSNRRGNSGVSYRYVYADASTPWRVSLFLLDNATHGAMAHTLRPLYTRSDLGHLMYNDQPPGGEVSFTRGHAKGIVAFAGTQGFWLIHSVPGFPAAAAAGTYEGFQPSHSIFGQSALCITMQSVDQAGDLLLLSHPLVYSASTGSQNMSLLPSLADVIAFPRRGRTSPPMRRTTAAAPAKNKTLQLILDTKDLFVAFSKRKTADVELYEDIVAPGLSSDLWVETWCRAPCDQSFCPTEYKWAVENVAVLNVFNDTYVRSVDHSKWAISSGPAGWLCVGDINRMPSQRKRGGGTVCLKNHKLWSTLHSWVAKVDGCPANISKGSPTTVKIPLD